MDLPEVVIIELGSQYTLLIERTLRGLERRSVVLDPKRAEQWLQQHTCKAVILSGGAASVYDADAPQPPSRILSLRNGGKPIPILGICYGMQWLVKQLGGSVGAVDSGREYGEHIIVRASEGGLLTNTPQRQTVWMSHGDSIVALPSTVGVTARSDSGTTAAIEAGHLYGVQFHPEVTHTPSGTEILRNFLGLAGCPKDWQPKSLIAAIQDSIADQLRGERVVFGYSGGVDSSVLAALLSSVLGDDALAVTIDGGHLRAGELDEIRAHAEAAGVTLRIISAHDAFAKVLAHTTDPEAKRAAFRDVYRALLVEAAHEFGATYIAQGTLAPDRIESGATGGATIKTHHNVGLSFGHLKQVHPLGDLFKYEVRALARELGLPLSISERQPFPGPGLFLRIVGVPVTPERLELVCQADAVVTDILRRHLLYEGISQLVVGLVGVNTVGVLGDQRAYGPAVVVRAVHTQDFMTAQGVYFPEPVAREIVRAVTAIPGIVRCWLDITDKPPATTEFE